jgi:hypothetical protein
MLLAGLRNLLASGRAKVAPSCVSILAKGTGVAVAQKTVLQKAGMLRKLRSMIINARRAGPSPKLTVLQECEGELELAKTEDAIAAAMQSARERVAKLAAT